jgi:16S rRNA (uracil1498-N3)-methyltransferase
VLRLREGEQVELCDSTGSVYVADLLSVGREIGVRLVSLHSPGDASDVVAITLAQCLPKGSKMDYVVEKATELGVQRIIPLQSERVIGERGSSNNKVDRWKRIARSAAEQSRSTLVPSIAEPMPWTELIAAIPSYDACLIAWEVEPSQQQRLEALVAGKRSVLIVIGPEGGLSHTEVSQVRSQGAHVVSLGKRILRTETAGLVAVALVRYAAGDL